MKKINIKLFTALLAVILAATAGIFYACNKEEPVKNLSSASDKNLKMETEFVVKNYDETCVQVCVSRDEHNNAQFVTKMVPNDPDAEVAFIISKTLNLKSQQEEGSDADVFEIPNDAIYWLILFDGNEPIKFEPIVSGAKTKPGSNEVRVDCTCMESKPDKPFPPDSHCEKKINQDYKTFCRPKDTGDCRTCHTTTTATSGLSTSILVGSAYLIKSNIVTINGIVYR